MWHRYSEMRSRFILVGGVLIIFSFAALKKALEIISNNRDVFPLYGSILHPSPQSIVALQNPGEVATPMIAAVLLLLFACLAGAASIALVVAGLISRSPR
jgi:hypothetical protein